MFTANNLAKLEEYQRLRNIGLTQKQALEETKLTNAMVLRAKKSKILTKSGLSTTSALEANLKTISPSGYVTAAFTAASVAARIWNGAISSNFEKAQSEIELADEQIQKYDEELSALNDLQSKLNDVGTNRENLAKIQVDLNKAIGETPGLLNGESDAFDKANLKIQARIEAIKLLRDEESKRKINATQTAFESKSLEDAIGILGINIDFSAQHMQQIARSQFATRNFWKDQGKTNEEIDEILDKGFSSSIGLTKKKYEDYQNELKRLAKEGLSDTISSYNGFGGSSIVDFIVDEFVDAGERDLNKINNALEDFIEDKDLQNLIDSYSSSLQDESENSEQYLGQINARLSILKNKFPEASAAFDVFYNTVVSGSENAEDSIDNFIENYEAKLKSLNEELDKIQSAYQTVAAAIEEYNENGYLSVDTYQKLLELAPEYMSMLMDESGNLTLTKESWRLLTEAKIRDMYQTQANQYIESIKAAADSGNLEQLDKLTQGYKNLAEAKVIDYKATLATLNLTDEQRAGAEAYLSGLEKAMNQTIAGLGKGGMGGGSNTTKKQEDLAKQIREKEKQIEEAWEKERLEQLKDDLEKRKNEIEKYKNYIETLDFGLDILDSSDYSGQIDLLEQKHESIVGYEQQLRDEMSRVLQIQYTTADEAQAIASRIQEIGSEMSNNKKILKETIVEMQKANIEATRAATIDVTSNLTDGLERSMWMLEKLDNPYNRNKDFLNRMMSFDSLFGEVSELDKELEKRKKHDKELIAEEQKTQDTIHQIVTDALKLQAEENAKTRAEERAKLEEELAEISKEYKSTLDTAAANTENTKNKITGSFNSVADSAGTMQQNVETHFGNMETSVTTHVDNTITKIDELTEKISKFNPLSYDPNQKLKDFATNSNLNKNGTSNPLNRLSETRPFGGGIVKTKYGVSSSNHKGVDFSADIGTSVYAYTDGTVVSTLNQGDTKGYGKYIVIDHGDGLTTLYGHLSSFNVEKGQKVKAGDVIAFSGDTGNSSGPHLHFEIRKNNVAQNPHSYLTYSNGTKDFGIAGENYKKEYAINKKTGNWSVVDSPTLFDKDEYEIVSEKVSEKIDKPIQTFATGTPMTNAEWLKYIKEACDAFGVPYNVALSLIDQESGNGTASDTWSYNSAGAYGLTQITKSALDDLYENTAVTNKIRQIFADNNVDMSKSRGGGIEHARDNIWVGIGNLAEIKDRYMKGDDSDWSKSLGYYYAGGNYNGTDGKWYSEQVLNRANSEAFVNAAEQLGKAIFDNIESLDENTNSVENSVDTNPFSDANIDKTIAAIADEGQDNKDKIDRYRRTTANAIASDRINGKLSETQFYEKQHDMISTLLNGNDDMLGLYGLLDLSVEKWDAAIKKYKDEAGENASSEVIEALEQAANDEFETFRELINNQTEMLQDFDNQIAEKNIDTYQKWWNRDLEAFDYEQVLRDRRISELQRQEGLTDDYLSTTALLNKEYKEWNDTFQYAIANNNAKALLVKEQNQQLQDVLDENGMTFDIASWFNPDGSISKQFEFDMKDVGFNYGEATLTEISGLVNGIASVNQSINAGVELSNQAVSRMLDIDKQRIEDLKTSLQKVMDDEKDYMNDKITYYNSLNSLLAKYYSVTNSITEAHHNINKELKAAQTSYKYLDAQTRLLLFNENDYVALTKELNDIQSKANRLKSQYEYDLLHAQKEDIAEITNNYERQYDLLMKQYEISKAKLEVEKKRIQLDNVLNERNVRMFVNGQWQWVANTQDVIDAQNELEDAKYNESKAGTELTQTQSLNNLSASAD